MARLSPKTTVKRAREQMYRGLILEAAEAEFAEHGIAAAKMQRIAKRAGIALGTLYGVFPGKNEIFNAVQALRGQEILEHVYRSLVGYSDFRDAAMRGIAAYATCLVERPNYLRMHLRDGLSWAQHSNLRSAEQRAAWERGMSLAVELLERGIERGLLRAEDGPEVQLKMLIAAHQVQLGDWLERGARTAEVPALIARMQGHFARAFVAELVDGSRADPRASTFGSRADPRASTFGSRADPRASTRRKKSG